MMINTKNITKTRLSQTNGKSFTYLPKNIFQTYASTELSKGAYDAVNSWRELNPSWNHYFFTDEDQRAFIQKHFDEDVLWAYDQLIPGAYKADLWRYCILYIEGGVYADHKLILHYPLDELLTNDTQFLSFQDKSKAYQRHNFNYHYIWQAFMVAPPKCPLFKEAIFNIIQFVKNGFYTHDPLSITGPGLLGAALATICTKTPSAKEYYHLLPSPFLKKSFNAIINNHPYSMSLYKTYHSERNQKTFSPDDFGQTDYVSAWFLGQVFQHKQCIRHKTSVYYEPKLRGFYRRHLKKAYRYQKNTYALQLIKTTLKRQWFQPKVWLIWLQQELFNKKRKSASQKD